MEIRRWIGVFCVGLFMAGAGGAQTYFKDVTDVATEPLFNARSIAFGDYDNDGWVDVFRAEVGSVVARRMRIVLLHNESHGKFRNQTALITAEIPQKPKGGGAIWGDYDNDGDLDLYVPIGEFRKQDADLNYLLRNDRGLFTEVTLEAGLTDRLPTDNAIWLDYDRDGFLDLYTGNPDISNPASRNKLYRNNGDGTFIDVTQQAGLDLPLHPYWGGTLGALAAGDFNDDGWPDLYIGNFGASNRLFLNDTQGGFRDATTSEIADPGEAWGAAIGDMDNDGDLDIFQAVSSVNADFRSLLLMNLGAGIFLDVTEGLGFGDLVGKKTVAPKFVDIDNDGDLDLLTAEEHYLYLNEGDAVFVERTSRSGMQNARTNTTLGDYNLDGFLDVWFGGGSSVDSPAGDRVPGRLYRNRANDNHWLRVELVGVESNRNGIGAQLKTIAGTRRQMKEIYGGWGFDQDEMVAHFGLGNEIRVDTLEIRWPSGQIEVLTAIPVDQKIRVIEGRDHFYTVEPTRWIAPPPDSLVLGSQVEMDLAVRPALFEPEARITKVTADLSAFGGATAIPLEDAGEGIYRMSRIPLTVEGSNGLRILSVLIDQQTSLGPYWTRLSRTITISPTEDQILYTDELGSSWKIGTIISADLDTQAKEVVYEGGSSLAVTTNGGFTVEFLPVAPVDMYGYRALHFAFYQGDITMGTQPAFSVILNDDPDYQVKLIGGDTERVNLNQEKPEWQVIEIPLAAFFLGQSIESIQLSGNPRGTFYLDDIRLVAAKSSGSSNTAITESHSATLPDNFSLNQNYPNPFNSSTTIRFLLPHTSEISLSIYNLAGQKVASLINGSREAGEYTIQWDGTDDQGNELASGVYLYRLEAGDHLVETKKLLLLR